MNITTSQILQQAKYNCNDEVMLQATIYLLFFHIKI